MIIIDEAEPPDPADAWRGSTVIHEYATATPPSYSLPLPTHSPRYNVIPAATPMTFSLFYDGLSALTSVSASIGLKIANSTKWNSRSCPHRGINLSTPTCCFWNDHTSTHSPILNSSNTVLLIDAHFGSLFRRNQNILAMEAETKTRERFRPDTSGVMVSPSF